MSTPPPPNPLQSFLDAIAPVIQDQDAWVTADLPRFIIQAITQRYSVDRPLTLVSDIAGNGTSLVAMPAAPEGQFGVFEPGFSNITEIEYPVGQIPRQLLDDSDWEVYRDPVAGYQLMLIAYVPTVEDSVRATWTARHSADGSTIYANDFYAVCDYAAALALEAMATRATLSGDNTIGADSVNYRTKAQEYQTASRLKRKSYFNHMGVDESDNKAEAAAAISMGQMHEDMLSGVGRLIHGKYTR